jgi:hypothetical protein
MVRIENSFLGIVAALLLFRHFHLISSSASGCGRNIRPAACSVASTHPLARIVLNFAIILIPQKIIPFHLHTVFQNCHLSLFRFKQIALNVSLLYFLHF